MRRAIDNIMAHTYPNIEFILQDGASTGGTLEVLKSYGEQTKLKSEPDSSSTEAFWRAIFRCTDEILDSCVADEELLPDAVEWAVRAFQAEPPPPDRTLKVRLYAQMARSYEKVGRMAQAVESWRFAAVAAGLCVPEDEPFHLDRWKDASAHLATALVTSSTAPRM